MKASFRTSPTVLAVAASMALASAFVISFGPAHLPQGELLARYPNWPYVAFALGFAGVLMILTKGRALPPFVPSRIPKYLVIAPLFILIVVSLYHRGGAGLAFFVSAIPAAYFALREDAVEAADRPRELLDFFGSGLLLLFGILGLAMPLPEAFFPPVAGLVLGLLLAPAAAVLCWRDPVGRLAAIARAALGAALVGVAAAAALGGQPIFSVFYGPAGLLLLAHPLLRGFRMGVRPPYEHTEENLVVGDFEKMAELTAWSVFLFTIIHVHLNPPGPAGVLFWLFVAAFVLFAVEYEVVSPRNANYDFIQKKSVANTLLLAVISHLTGGIQSPYVWFFVLIVVSGAFVPNPVMILRRLYVIVAYYVVEVTYSSYHGLLNKALIVDFLVIQIFVIGLAGIYAYRLALRRRQVDEDLMAKNQTLRSALQGEQAAKALAERSANDLRLANDRRVALLASLADAVVSFDGGGHVESLNPAAEGLLGFTLDEVKGKHLSDFLRFRREGDEAFRIGDYLDSALKGNAITLPDNVYLEGRSAAKRYVIGAAVPLFGDRRKVSGAVFTFSDVTYAREVDQMKTSFLSVAAHQLRTPLSTIRWYLELLDDPSEGRLKKNQKLFVGNAYLSLRKMVGLVNRLLAVTRLEAGRVPFRPEPTDLKALTEEILESLRQKLQGRELNIRIDIPDLPSVPLDPTLAREVLVNLVENAVRYTPDGGTITIGGVDLDDRIEWRIADTGIGIPKAQQEKIFGKFFRAANALEYSSEGSGLGLYLAKFIVGTWGGELAFESEEGRGSTFRVTVPKVGMKAKSGNVSLNA